MSGTTTHKPEEQWIVERRSPVVGTLEFEGLINRYTIIGTRFDVYELWQPIVTQEDRGHFTSQRTFDGVWYGQVGVGGDYERREFSEQIIRGLVDEQVREGDRIREGFGRVEVIRFDPED